MTQRIKWADITCIALCPRGANNLRTIYKADGKDSVQVSTLTKQGEEGELLSLVYAPEQIDLQGQLASASVIKDTAHRYLRDHRDIDIRHEGKILSKDQAFVAESFIVAKGDERFEGWEDYDGQKVDTEGAWATVIKIEDPALRQAYRDGDWDGVSMFGMAVVEEAKELDDDEISKAADRIAQRLAKELGANTSTGDIDMDIKELKKVLEETFGARLEAVEKLVEKLGKEDTGSDGNDGGNGEEQGTGTPAPIFKGDPQDGRAVAKFAKEYEAWSLQERLAKATADGKHDEVAKILAKMQSQADPEPTVEELKKAGIPAEESDDPKVRELQVELFKAYSASSQEDGEDNEDVVLHPLGKEMQSGSKIGSRIAKIINDRRTRSNTASA